MTSNLNLENISNVTLAPCSNIESPSPKVNYHLVPVCFLWHQISCEFRGAERLNCTLFFSIRLFKSVLLSGPKVERSNVRLRVNFGCRCIVMRRNFLRSRSLLPPLPALSIARREKESRAGLSTGFQQFLLQKSFGAKV